MNAWPQDPAARPRLGPVDMPDLPTQGEWEVPLASGAARARARRAPRPLMRRRLERAMSRAPERAVRNEKPTERGREETLRKRHRPDRRPRTRAVHSPCSPARAAQGGWLETGRHEWSRCDAEPLVTNRYESIHNRTMRVEPMRREVLRCASTLSDTNCGDKRRRDKTIRNRASRDPADGSRARHDDPVRCRLDGSGRSRLLTLNEGPALAAAYATRAAPSGPSSPSPTTPRRNAGA